MEKCRINYFESNSSVDLRGPGNFDFFPFNIDNDSVFQLSPSLAAI